MKDRLGTLGGHRDGHPDARGMADEMDRSQTEDLDKPVDVARHGPDAVPGLGPVTIAVAPHVHADDVEVSGQFSRDRVPRVALDVEPVQHEDARSSRRSPLGVVDPQPIELDPAVLEVTTCHVASSGFPSVKHTYHT